MSLACCNFLSRYFQELPLGALASFDPREAFAAMLGLFRTSCSHETYFQSLFCLHRSHRNISYYSQDLAGACTACVCLHASMQTWMHGCMHACIVFVCVCVFSCVCTLYLCIRLLRFPWEDAVSLEPSIFHYHVRPHMTVCCYHQDLHYCMCALRALLQQAESPGGCIPQQPPGTTTTAVAAAATAAGTAAEAAAAAAAATTKADVATRLTALVPRCRSCLRGVRFRFSQYLSRVQSFHVKRSYFHLCDRCLLDCSPCQTACGIHRKQQCILHWQQSILHFCYMCAFSLQPKRMMDH